MRPAVFLVRGDSRCFQPFPLFLIYYILSPVYYIARCIGIGRARSRSVSRGGRGSVFDETAGGVCDRFKDAARNNRRE
jgi:hypothetical protein